MCVFAICNTFRAQPPGYFSLLGCLFVCPLSSCQSPRGPLLLPLVELHRHFHAAQASHFYCLALYFFPPSTNEWQVLQIFSNLILCLWWKSLFHLKISPKPWRLLPLIKIYSLVLWHASLLNCISALRALMEKNLLAVIFSIICLRF